MVVSADSQPRASWLTPGMGSFGTGALVHTRASDWTPVDCASVTLGFRGAMQNNDAHLMSDRVVRHHGDIGYTQGR